MSHPITRRVVIIAAIAAVVAWVSVLQYQNAIARRREAALRAELFKVRDAIDRSHADKRQ